jgi:hypothetical protein
MATSVSKEESDHEKELNLMTKTRTGAMRPPGPAREQEFHQKLEKGAKTAALHRQKVRQDEQEAQRPSPARSHAAHLAAGRPAAPKAKPGDRDDI